MHISFIFFNTCKNQCLSQSLSTKLILKVVFLLFLFLVVNMQSIRNTKISWVEFFRTRAVRYKPGVDIKDYLKQILYPVVYGLCSYFLTFTNSKTHFTKFYINITFTYYIIAIILVIGRQF